MELLDDLKKVKTLHNSKAKYRSFAESVADFSINFNQDIFKFAIFLIHNNFHKKHNVYVRIDYDDFIKLDSDTSEKSLLFVLKYLNNSDFRKEDDFYLSDYYPLMHILIDENDLLSFEPLKSQIVDIRIGNSIYEGVPFSEINHEELKQEMKRDLEESRKFFEEKLDELKSEYKQEQEINNVNNQMHPSLDKLNKNHAPELLMAIEAWEARYLNNQYPHQEHTPAITLILKNKNITQTNLVKRICAITNPKK